MKAFHQRLVSCAVAASDSALAAVPATTLIVDRQILHPFVFSLSASAYHWVACRMNEPVEGGIEPFAYQVCERAEANFTDIHGPWPARDEGRTYGQAFEDHRFATDYIWPTYIQHATSGHGPPSMRDAVFDSHAFVDKGLQELACVAASILATAVYDDVKIVVSERA